MVHKFVNSSRDSTFKSFMNYLEIQAWDSFKEMIVKFLENFKAP
jgi:hypothetical protein